MTYGPVTCDSQQVEPLLLARDPRQLRQPGHQTALVAAEIPAGRVATANSDSPRAYVSIVRGARPRSVRNTVCGDFAKWADEGVFAQLNGMLGQLLREEEGRDAEPSACVTDARSGRTSTSVHASGQGIDAGEKTAGRKRSIATGTLGLLLAVLVTAASMQDSASGTRLLDTIPWRGPKKPAKGTNPG